MFIDQGTHSIGFKVAALQGALQQAKTWAQAHPDRQVMNNGAQCCWIDRRICTHYGTAMALIILQIPNNYLPIFQR